MGTKIILAVLSACCKGRCVDFFFSLSGDKQTNIKGILSI